MYAQTLNSEELSIKNIGNGLPRPNAQEHSLNVNASIFVPRKLMAPAYIDKRVQYSGPQYHYNPQFRSFNNYNNPPVTNFIPPPRTETKKIPIIDPRTQQEITLVNEVPKKTSTPIPIIDPKTMKEASPQTSCSEQKKELSTQITSLSQTLLPLPSDQNDITVHQNHEEPVKEPVSFDEVQTKPQKTVSLEDTSTKESSPFNESKNSECTKQVSNSEVKSQIDGNIVNTNEKVEEIPAVEISQENKVIDLQKVVSDVEQSLSEDNSTSDSESIEVDKENYPSLTNQTNQEVLNGNHFIEMNSKRIYDRDFLLKFQNLYTQRPENLPEIEVALGDEPDKNLTWQRKNFSRSGSRDSHEKENNRTPRRKDFSNEKNTPRWNGNKKVGDVESETLRTIKSLMNKITVENFVSISDKIVRIEIPNEKVLSSVIDQIFVKAVSEPHFSSLYADLCSKISKYQALQVSESTDAKFRKFLLNKCQQEFENRPPSLIAGNDKLDIEQEELEFKRRHRIFGNMKFIGELFKKGMLQDHIMFSCLKSLLSNGKLDQVSAEDIECLCSLLQTIGKKLDTERNVNIFNTIFEMIGNLHNNPKLGARIRFALLDLIELRKFNWTPRRKEEGPKKINEIHKEAEEYQTPTLRPVLTPKSINKEKEKSEPQRSQPAADAWQTPSRKSHSEVLKGSKKKDDKKNTHQKETKKEKTVQPNAYDLLHEQPKPKNNNNTKASSVLNGKTSEVCQASNTTLAVAKNLLSEEELNSKLSIIIEEFLNSEERDEAVGYIKDLNASHLHSNVINTCLITAVDKTKISDRNNLSQLVVSLAKENVVKSQDFSKGFRQLFDEIEDLSIDIPRAPENAAYLFAESVSKGCVDVRLLDDFSGLWSATPFGEKFLSAYLKSALQLTDEHSLKEEVTKSQLNLLKFLPEDDQNASSLQCFLEKHSLSFLVETS